MRPEELSPERLTQRFEADRPRLRAVAIRMLGSVADADDAVQESWLRVARSDLSPVENPEGWFTTTVSRVCLDQLRARKARGETAPPADAETVADRSDRDPEHEAILSETVGTAMLVVLDVLSPAERVAFVLHDVFGLSFEEIGTVLERSATAARQLASRARRRVRGAEFRPEPDHARERRVLDAFRAASRGGDLQALLAVLAPDVVLRADAAAVAMGASPEVRGAEGVAGTFVGRAAAARPALLGGALGLAWAPGDRLRVGFRFTFVGDRIASIHLVADPEALARLGVVLLDE